MITIKARINVSGNGGTINSLTSNAVGNNISSPISAVLGKRSVTVKNPFILGVSKLGSGATYYADTLPYFMGKEFSNAYGVFPNPYTFTINGISITQFIITFDTVNGAFPKSITVDNKTYVDDDSQWEIIVDSKNTHTITIDNWNKPNSPLIITSIYADINIEIDKYNLISFDSDILDKSNIEQPSYGVISNTANLSFNDFTEQVLDLIVKKLLHSGVGITVYLDNDISNKQEQVCQMYIQSLSYDNDNRAVSLSLKDNLEVMQNINVSPIYYTPTVSTEQPLSFIYEELYNLTIANGFDMLSLDELDETTKSILEDTMLVYPLLESSNLWNEWDKLCQATLSNMYVDRNGVVVFRHKV